MSITRDAVLAAVEKYLPQTVNYAKSADLGKYDQDSVFNRIVQIILTAILTDKDAIFFIVYLASQRLLRDVEEALAALDTLDGPDALRGISQTPATRIDPAGLNSSQNALLRMGSSLVSDTFGVNQFDNFDDSITTFLEDQVVPNVADGGNNEKASRQIESSLGQLASAWAQILDRREKLFSILTQYESVDLRVRVASTVISAIRGRISELQESLPTLSTPEHGAQSEQILVDLTAANSALGLIARAESPFGSTIVGPLADGFTGPDYLLVEGSAAIDPVGPLLRGTDGKVIFDQTLVSTLGETVDSGGDLSTLWTDPSVFDFTTAVAVGQYFTNVTRGERATITGVSATELALSAGTLNQPGVPQRYVVTQSPPGSFFQSLSNSFWDEYFPGSTQSTMLASGTLGEWSRIDKQVGSDGTNIKASGSIGILRPRKSTGSLGVQSAGLSTFSDAGASFLSDGVVSADNLIVTGPNAPGPYTVDQVLSQTDLTILQIWGSGGNTPWVIEDQFASFHFEANVDLFSFGVTTSDTLEITSGLQAGSYSISSFVSSSRVYLTTGVSFDNNVSWEIRYANNVFVSANATFLGSGVVAGDILDITGIGIFTISSVDSQTQVTLTAALPSYFSGASYAVYTSGTQTTKFSQADAVDFEALGIAAFVNGAQVYLNVGGVDYEVVSLDLGAPANTLYVSAAAPINAGPLTWSLRAGDSTRTFFDTANSPFTENLVGAILVYRPGTSEEIRSSIQGVVSSSEVTLSKSFPQGETNVPYALITTYKSGLQLLIAGRRYDILEVKDRNTLRVDPPVALTVGKDIQFYVVYRGSDPLNYRLTDAVGALSFGPAGFPVSLVGTTFDLMTDTQGTARINAVVDINGDSVFEAFDVSASYRIGLRNVIYRIRQALPGSAQEFRTGSPSALSAAADDILTIWSLDGYFTVQSVSSELPDYVITTAEPLPARIADQDFIVVRGGSSEHGRYLLLEGKNAVLPLDQNTEDLRVACAEVLLDFGATVFPITSGTSADLSLDEDQDGYTTRISDPSATFVTDGVLYGHRIDITYPDLSVKRSYVVSIPTETSLIIDPPLKIPTPAGPLAWSIVRSSVSNALDDSQALRVQLQALQEILDRYVVPQNETILNVLNLLKKQRMDRAVDLIYDGDFLTFAQMRATDSSYASNARASIQTVGRSTTPASFVSGSGNTGQTTNLAGIDPNTGKSSPSQTRASATGQILSGGQDIETRVTLAKAVASLAADERIRSMLQISLDEMINSSIYELTGEIESGLFSDVDPTLPWIAKTGSVRDRLVAQIEAALSALQYMIDHPDDFEDVEAGGTT